MQNVHIGMKKYTAVEIKDAKVLRSYEVESVEDAKAILASTVRLQNDVPDVVSIEAKNGHIVATISPETVDTNN